MAAENDIRAEQLAALEAARAAIDRAMELLGEPCDTDRPTVHAVEPDWRPLKEAAGICGVHPETMARQARVHGLGRRRGRVWRIDMSRVRAWEEGRPYARLMPEDSANCRQLSDAPDDTSAAS